MTSLTTNPHPQQKYFFRVQTRRLATSFDTSTRYLTCTGAEIFLRKATCNPAVFLRTAWINPDVKVLKKKNFWFYEDTKNFTWPRAQPLGQSISLKFSLETRLESESFERLINFLVFLVQNLWSKMNELINTFVSGLIQVVRVKIDGLYKALHENLSDPVSATDLVKSPNNSASLVVCTLKKFFWLGGGDILRVTL